MTNRSPTEYRIRVQRGWSESTLYRWWVGAGQSPADRLEIVPREVVAVALLWLLVVLAIS